MKCYNIKFQVLQYILDFIKKKNKIKVKLKLKYKEIKEHEK